MAEFKLRSPAQGSVDAKTSPYPYSISIPKLIVLSVATFGAFEVYWFFKQFKSFKAARNWEINPWLRAIFCMLTSYTLFREVEEAEKEIDPSKDVFAWGLAIAFFVIAALWRLPDPYWLLGFLSFVPLIPAQNSINFYWDRTLGENLVRSKFGGWNYVVAIVGMVFVLGAVLEAFSVS